MCQEQYRALLKAYGPASGAMRLAESDQQRKAAVERLAEFAPKFVKLVEDNSSMTGCECCS